MGFLVREDKNEELLISLEAPLEDKSVAHHYLVTTEGEALNVNQLVADLASNKKVVTLLIHDPPLNMMYDKVKTIKAEHLHSSAKGKAGFLQDDMKHTDGHTRVCYWPDYYRVSDLHEDVVKARHK